MEKWAKDVSNSSLMSKSKWQKQNEKELNVTISLENID